MEMNTFRMSHVLGKLCDAINFAHRVARGVARDKTMRQTHWFSYALALCAPSLAMRLTNETLPCRIGNCSSPTHKFAPRLIPSLRSNQ
jgi:hypothetical protein